MAPRPRRTIRSTSMYVCGSIGGCAANTRFGIPAGPSLRTRWCTGTWGWCVWAPSGIEARARKREILLREPDAGKLHVRFDEREVETEQGRAREAPADERAGRIGPPKPPRHFSTLLSLFLSVGHGACSAYFKRSLTVMTRGHAQGTEHST